MKRVAIALYLSWVLFLTILVQAQLPESLNIDCGATSSYEDQNHWKYVKDDEFIETGTTFNVSSSFYSSSLRPSYRDLRSFPSGKRNCFNLTSVNGTKYLIGAEFFYGNYDNLTRPPQFDLYFGTEFWKTVDLNGYPEGLNAEVITVATSNSIFVCLINTGKGTPIISAMRLITLPENMYEEMISSGSLILYGRWNVGSNDTVRYPQDIDDRIWKSWNIYASISTNNEFNDSSNNFKPPTKVLQTASVPKDNGDSLFWNWPKLKDSSDLYHIALHFAEVEALKENESRQFNIYIQGSFAYGPLQPRYLNVSTVYSKKPLEGKTLSFSINKATNSMRPPLLNAMELFQVKKFNGSTTDRQDVEAIIGIKDTYQIKKNWMGDPCLPKDYSWSGLTCNDKDSPKITALNLSSSGLVGSISNYLVNISSIEYIDLSNNNLTGTIPEFLAQLTSLKGVNLSNNWLSGSIPNSLQERTRNGLKLSTDNNPGLDNVAVENHKGKKSATVAIIISAISAGFILFVVLIILRRCRRKNKPISIHNGNMSNRDFKASTIQNGQESLSIRNKYENIRDIDQQPTRSRLTSFSTDDGNMPDREFELSTTRSRQTSFSTHDGNMSDREIELPTTKSRQTSFSTHNGNTSNKELGRPAAAAEHKVFRYSEVLEMTDNLKKKIGGGGFGFVYFGLHNEMPVAVKILSEDSHQGFKEFDKEVKLLMKVHHKNLISLVGYCDEDTKKVLIYEFMDGGNLREALSSGSESPSMSWKERLHIAIGAAQGLEYLHDACDPQIIHRDVKTANILLNKGLEAKIADFGLSKVYQTGVISPKSSLLMGTQGYMDPEWQTLPQLNKKSDVYSFGVVLLELLTGLPPDGIVKRVNTNYQKGELRKVIDSKLNGEYDTNIASKFAKIALECTLKSNVERPSMSKVASELKECLLPNTKSRLEFKRLFSNLK